MAPSPERPGGVPVTRSNWALVRTVGGLGILALLLCLLGTGPFLDGLRLIDGWALAVALGIGALTTVCCAWRWSLVSGGLGVRLPLGTAVAHCYRAVFLNSTLPGGVLGDVHRAVRHGRDAGDVGRGIRAVVWERTAGQVVQAGIALAVLFAFPSPVRSYLPAATGWCWPAGSVPSCWFGQCPGVGTRGGRRRCAPPGPTSTTACSPTASGWASCSPPPSSSRGTWRRSWSRRGPRAPPHRCRNWCH